MSSQPKFYPSNQQPPNQLLTSKCVLQPLQTAHVKLDYDALMEDPAYLRAWSQSGWPADNFSLAENRRDLERHEHEHRTGIAYTFTVLSTDADRCLGCVYITPIGHRIALFQIPEQKQPSQDDYSADVCFWVRPSLHKDDFDHHLLSNLIDWFSVEWPFTQIYFHTSADDLRQQGIFEQTGLEFIGDLKTREPRAGHWFLYLD